jgi:hypothetical protein
MSLLLKIVLSMSLNDGHQISHHELNNVHQNELERNSLDVDNPHCNWQISLLLKSCAVTIALHLDVSVAFGIATFDPCADSVHCWVAGVHRDAKYYRQLKLYALDKREVVPHC